MNEKKSADPIQYPRAQFEGQIHLIDQDHLIEEAILYLKEHSVIGFDTETRPSFKKGEVYKVALLQLSTHERAYLFRLHHLNHFHFFKDIFENKAIEKVGVAIRDDIKTLQKLFNFTPHQFVELQDIAKNKGLKSAGLKTLCEEVLSLTLSKKAKLTNWEARALTKEQMHYAATDAWIGLKLYLHLTDRN